MIDAETAAILAALRANYLLDLPRRVAVLGVFVSSASSRREELVAGAHQLAGNAGSFGCPGVSVAARALLEAARGGAGGSELQSRFDALVRAVDEVTRPG